MNEIKIRCPKCGKILRLADSPNINNSVFTCPVCKEKSKVGNCQRVVDAPRQTVSNEETQYGSLASRMGGGEETQYANSGASSNNVEETRIYSEPKLKVGVLADNYGATYQLHIGINTIGRQASTSPATVQIKTDDRTMSRSHAIIDVRNSGGQIIHILRNGANKNPSYLNGTLIEANDQLILNNGDRVKFGSTELTFKRPL